MLSVWLIAASTAIASYGFTWGARYLAPKIGYIDKPDGGRKAHHVATPLLGGVAVILSFTSGLVAILLTSSSGVEDSDSRRFIFGLLLFFQKLLERVKL